MIDKVKEDILSILPQAIQFLNEKNSQDLKELSNHAIQSASIYQDKDSVTIAVVIYALSKIVDRIGRIEPEILDNISRAKKAIDNNSFEEYESVIKHLIEIVSTVDKKMNMYVHHIVNEAGIKKGSKLYGSGISVAQTADIFGISQWELMKYVGQTNIPEEFADEVDISTRIMKARELFGL